LSIEEQFKNIYNDKLTNAVSSLFTKGLKNDECFLYANLISRLQKFPTERIPTMAVSLNKKNRNICLIYNPKFVEEISFEELQGVIIHESSHIVNMHFDRGEGKDPSKFNIAADIAINQQIIESGFSLPKGVVLPIDDMEPWRDAEYYYDYICKNPECLEQFGGTLREGTCDNHDDWKEISDSVEATEKARSLVKKVAEEGLRHGNNAGNHWLDILAKRSKKNWKAELRAFFQPSTYNVAYKTNRFDKRRTYHDGSDMIPARHKTPFRHKVFVAVDVSGSITDEQISCFIGEIIKMKECADIVTLIFDTEIVQEIRDVKSKVTVKGRGGTCFQPIFDRLAKEKDERNVVILTDGYADTRLNIPSRTKALWAVIPGGRKEDLPGKVISLPNYL